MKRFSHIGANLLALSTMYGPAIGGEQSCKGDPVKVHGVMHFLPVEGGCWQFEDDTGGVYQPVGGPFFMYCEEFSGTLTGCLQPDMISFCQVGPIVSVTDFVPDTFDVHGEMQFIDVEGGCWRFLSDAGTSYEPFGGPPEMFVDGQTGLMTAYELCLLGSFCQVGTIVQVVGFAPDNEFCLADFESDGIVGPADLALLLGAWGPCVGCPADLDGDGTVGPADLAVLLGSWGACF